MTLPKILVMGATGKTGGAVVTELLAKGYPVRAIVRREDARSQALRARGVEIATGDMGDAERVTAAMQGVQRAYFLPPYDPNMLRGAAAFAAAASQARIQSIVMLSQWLASPSHPGQLTRDIWLAEKMFGQIRDVGCTVVNTGLFADSPYLDAVAYSVHLGVYPWAFGDSLDAPPSVEDIGRVCAAALMDPDRHAGARYRPTGPALLSGRDMANAVGRALGRKVVLAAIPGNNFIKAVRRFGAPDALLADLPAYMEDRQRRAFEFGAPNEVVREMTGRAPETFETVARRIAGRIPRGLGPTLGQIGEFLTLPFAPGFDAEAYRRELRVQPPAKVVQVTDSPVWRAEHGVVANAVLPPRPAG